MGFYDLSADERIALTRRAITERRTVVERWSGLETPESTPWSERSALAARLLESCTSVADVGCGLMQLRPYLRAGTRYVGVDVVARDEHTIVVDLNRQDMPLLKVDGFALLGLLEYLFDVPRLLRQLKGTVVASYNPVDVGEGERLAHAWVNAYNTAGLESIFYDTGWAIARREALGRQRLWQLVR